MFAYSCVVLAITQKRVRELEEENFQLKLLLGWSRESQEIDAQLLNFQQKQIHPLGDNAPLL